MIEKVLLKCVGTSIGQQGGVSLDDRLIDIGLDSLRFIQLVVQLEHTLNIEFADEKLDCRLFVRIRDILLYLEELGSTSAAS